MQITFSRRSGETSRTLHVDVRLLLAASLSALLLILGLGVWLGYRLLPGSAAEQPLVQQLEEQKSEVLQVRADAERQLEAYSLHLAEMQARLTRLDALGERLTELADLDASEFDFSLSVGQGGPEDLSDGPAFEPPAFMQTIDELVERLNSREQQLEVLEQYLGDRRLESSRYLSGWPVEQGYVSSGFGRRLDPFSGRSSLHKGVDFSAPAGTEIMAVASGVVTWSGRKRGYGNVVDISHSDGYVTRYAHNQRNLVGVGEVVRRGQVIGLVGSSGRSTGAHVHFEVIKNGRVVNPASYIALNSKDG